ncbi:MAG TPA: hypothetical protein VED20_00840, partial [Streptosporangiaceae bacterium]|nr:hypothetical protein [Streptosporangiaceae bacterium]
PSAVPFRVQPTLLQAAPVPPGQRRGRGQQRRAGQHGRADAGGGGERQCGHDASGQLVSILLPPALTTYQSAPNAFTPCPWAVPPAASLALNTAIWFNWQIGAPVKRSLIAYDH